MFLQFSNYIFEQCDICDILDFGTVLTVWYFRLIKIDCSQTVHKWLLDSPY
jgi:hypothetical protein